MLGKKVIYMAGEHNLDAIVGIYTTGWLHNQFAELKLESVLHDYEKVLVQTHCPNRDAEILTLGCGAGRETFALYHMGYHHVRGVDCTPALLEIARNRAKTSGLNVEFALAFAHNLPFPDSTFDVVCMFVNLYGHITPHSERLRTLAEVRRVLKPGGIVLMNAASILNNWLVFSFIKMQEIIRLCYNPHGLERGDKLFRGARKQRKSKDTPLARSHWFRPNEVPQEAQTVGLTVIQATTIKGLLNNPKGNCSRVHKQGWLVYVLQRRE